MGSNEQANTDGNKLLFQALTELSRTINIISTYGETHPAIQLAADHCMESMTLLFKERKKVNIGSFNGTLTIDEVPATINGTLLKSLERRLTLLQITGLKLEKGICKPELLQLATLLACKESESFQSGLKKSDLSHITSESFHLEAVHENEAVANLNDIGNMGDGVLVLDDEEDPDGGSQGGNDVHIDQIFAFLKGDIDLEDVDIDSDLAELASDPARLGKMIMESVSIRQATSNISGESLGDIVLGCLRRTFDGIRKQPTFQDSAGKADLRKSLLLLEENLLEKMRSLTGDADPELDRQIVQAIREMDENIGFEMAAMHYMEHRDAIKQDQQELQNFVHEHGTDAAKVLLSQTDFPESEWRKIVIESRRAATQNPNDPSASSLNTLASVFERLEKLMKSENASGPEMKELLGQASENIDDSSNNTKDKLELLSQHLQEDEQGSIGGDGANMSQSELLAALSEVAQELMQPLTAINASLEMLLSGFVGDVTTDQQDMLNLAANSGEHLKYLMKELIRIVGCPTNKGVDERYHTTSAEVLMKNVQGKE